MGSSGMVSLKAIWAMLKICAPDHTREATDHHWRITWNGRCYPTLPKGAHGARKTVEIERGHVKRMVRHLGIEACAKAQIPGL